MGIPRAPSSGQTTIELMLAVLLLTGFVLVLFELSTLDVFHSTQLSRSRRGPAVAPCLGCRRLEGAGGR